MDIPREGHAEKVRRKRILYAILTVAAITIVTVALARLEPAAPTVERSTLYLGTVERGEMLREVRGPGNLVPEERRWIPARTQGRVEHIIIKPGTEVLQGTPIIELSNPDVEQQFRDAELQLRAAQANYEDLRVRLESDLLNQRAAAAAIEADYQAAQLDAEANEELAKDGLVPDIELRRSRIRAEQLKNRNEIEKERLAKTAESLEAQLNSQRAQLEQSRELYNLRKEEQDSLIVRSPLSGVLQVVPVEEGEQVAPGANLARVAMPDRLMAELRIAETQAKDIQVGQLATIDTRNGVIPGNVRRIDPAAQEGTVTVEVELTGELPRGARPDLSVDGVIEIERLANVLHVLRPAYGQANSKISLFKLSEDGSRAQRVQVQLGRSSVSTFEIVEGLQEGDAVILSDTSQYDSFDRLNVD